MRVQPGEHISGQFRVLSGFCNFVRKYQEGYLIHYCASSCSAPSLPALPGEVTLPSLPYLGGSVSQAALPGEVSLKISARMAYPE